MKKIDWDKLWGEFDFWWKLDRSIEWPSQKRKIEELVEGQKTRKASKEKS